ncbi:MAG: beta strand repeat-containing protein, partial [Caldimonas sp.]
MTSTGAQTYGPAVLLGADAALDAGSGAIAFASTVDGAHGLRATTTGNVTFGAAVGGATPLTDLGASGQTVTIGSATLSGVPGGAIDLTGSRNVVVTGTLASNGAPITLAGNSAGTSTGSFVGVALTGAALDAGGGDITVTGAGGSVGANDHGIQLTNSSLRTSGGGAITLAGTGGGTSGRGVTIGNAGAAQVISSADGNVSITGTASGAALDTVYSGFGESSLAATGQGTVSLRALGTGDANGLSIGTTGTALDYYGPALTQWQLQTASNLVFTGLGVTKTTGGDSTWTISAPKSVVFSGAAGVNASSGKLNLTFNADSNADQSGYVSLASGTFNTNGGNIVLGGGADPASGFAWGNSADPVGIRLIGTTLNAGGGDIAMHGHGWSNPAGSHGIYTQGGTTIQTTGNGAIALVGIGGDQVTAPQSTGVLLNQVTRVLGQDGDITITGTGGNNTGGSFGVYLDNFLNGTYGGTEVVSSGAGRISITGSGGSTASAGGNIGFVINFNSLVQGAYGDITITGNGGSSSGTRNDGISWNSSGTILSTGTGPNAARINVTGNAGSGSGNTYGMFLNADKVIAGLNSFATACAVSCNGPTISSVDGDIALRGTGSSGTGSGNNGINVANVYTTAGAAPVQIAGLGAASVSVTGIGGNGSGGGNSGVQMVSGAGTGGLAIQTAGSGNVVLAGVPGGGGSGVSANVVSTVRSSGTGNVTLLVDSLALGAANTIGSAAALTIAPFTDGTTLGVGSAATGVLGLSDAVLASLTWGSLLTLGGTSAGATTINTAATFAHPLAIVSGSGADITLAAPLTSTSGALTRTITLSAGRNFLNTAGATALDPGAGVWRVYSTDPGTDARGGLAPAFKQYDASYGVTPVLGSGDGVLYRIAPVLTPSLVGTVAKVYDGGTVATLGPSNAAVTGTIDGDSATVAVGSAGLFDTRNVGTGKVVSSAGMT